MQDVIIDSKVVEKNTYISRKGKTFEHLGSDPSEWQPAKIKDYLIDGRGKEIPIYHIGSIKETRCIVGKIKDLKTRKEKELWGTPIEYIHDENDYTHVQTPFSLKTINCCELCGHPIMNPHILINYSKKFYMIVGSECIQKHYGRVIRETIKTFKDNKARQEFREIRERCITFLKGQLDLNPSYCDDYKAYVNRTGRLKYWAFKAKNELEKIVPEHTSSKKLMNRIQKMRQMMVVK